MMAMTLTEYRKSKGLTKAALAKLLKCAAPTIVRYEQGRMPDADMCRRIVKMTGGLVSGDDLLFPPSLKRKRAAV